MLPESPAPEQPHETPHDAKVRPLTWLRDEVNQLSAVASLVPDMGLPYVHVSVPST